MTIVYSGRFRGPLSDHRPQVDRSGFHWSPDCDRDVVVGSVARRQHVS